MAEYWKFDLEGGYTLQVFWFPVDTIHWEPEQLLATIRWPDGKVVEVLAEMLRPGKWKLATPLGYDPEVPFQFLRKRFYLEVLPPRGGGRREARLYRC